MKPRYHYNNTPLRRTKPAQQAAMDKLIDDILKLMAPGKPLLIILPKWDGPQN